MKNLFLLLVVFIFAFQSCSDSEDDIEKTTPSVTSPFAGSWSGTFDGDDTGTWRFVVDVNSNITEASSFSNNASRTFQGATGSKISDSGLVTITESFGVVSNMRLTGDILTGTWVNPTVSSNFGGTLSGSRN